ncbi:MAG: TonB-dependent receptor, partial [Blastocatellia bacterium]
MNKLRLKNIFLCLILAFLYQTTIVLGQVSPTSAIVRGAITDEQGGVIVGATVVIQNLNTNLTRETTVGETGEYLLTQLPPGNYEIKISADGFAGQVVKDFNLELGTDTKLDLQLKLSTTSEIIEITATDSVGAITRNIESSTNVSVDRINGLPINRRDFLDFTLTTPRVVRDRTPSVGVIAGTGLSFNGQPGRFNNVTIDGLDNNESITGAVRATFSQEAVQEFQVVSDSFTSEFGRALGGVVNIVTKGGGNSFHGNLFFLNRNDDTSSRDVFAPNEPRFQQYQFGATLGGPIKKDKIFFFSSFERLSVKRSNLVTISDDSVKAAASQGFFFRNGAVPVAINNSTGLIRLDANISPNNLLFVRYNFSGSFDGALEPFGGLIAETNGGTQILTDSSLAINNTYINVGLNFINETRFLYGKRDQNLFANNDGPRVQVLAPEGLILFGRPALLPQPRLENFYHIINNVTIPRQKHRIKFGADFIFANPNADKTKVPLFGGGFALFQPLNFEALTGVVGAPTLTGLQALDPSLRTP